MTFKELVKERYSCRKFLNKKVENDKIQELLDVIHLAPTAENKQPLRVWVINNEERLQDMKKITSYHYNAPLTIAIGYVDDEAWVRKSDQKAMGIVDASIAATTLWFEAEELGLGCVWVSAFDTEKQKEVFPEMKECEIVAFMQLGYPDPTGPKAKWHYQKRDRSEMFFEL